MKIKVFATAASSLVLGLCGVKKTEFHVHLEEGLGLSSIKGDCALSCGKEIGVRLVETRYSHPLEIRHEIGVPRGVFSCPDPYKAREAVETIATGIRFGGWTGEIYLGYRNNNEGVLG